MAGPSKTVPRAVTSAVTVVLLAIATLTAVAAPSAAGVDPRPQPSASPAAAIGSAPTPGAQAKASASPAGVAVDAEAWSDGVRPFASHLATTVAGDVVAVTGEQPFLEPSDGDTELRVFSSGGQRLWTVPYTDRLATDRVAVGPAGQVVTLEQWRDDANATHRRLVGYAEGERGWEVALQAGTPTSVAPVLGSDGLVYVFDAEGPDPGHRKEIVGVDPSSGTVRHRIPLPAERYVYGHDLLAYRDGLVLKASWGQSWYRPSSLAFVSLDPSAGDPVDVVTGFPNSGNGLTVTHDGDAYMASSGSCNRPPMLWKVTRDGVEWTYSVPEGSHGCVFGGSELAALPDGGVAWQIDPETGYEGVSVFDPDGSLRWSHPADLDLAGFHRVVLDGAISVDESGRLVVSGRATRDQHLRYAESLVVAVFDATARTPTVVAAGAPRQTAEHHPDVSGLNGAVTTGSGHVYASGVVDGVAWLWAFGVPSVSLPYPQGPIMRLAQAGSGDVCADDAPLVLIGVRGTTEAQEPLDGMGATVYRYYTGIRDSLADREAIDGHGLVYPARPPNLLELFTDVAEYSMSLREGVASLTTELTERYYDCPDVDLILSGYSQGAHVIQLVLERIDPKIRDRVIAVDLFGSPVFDDDDPAAVGTFVSAGSDFGQIRLAAPPPVGATWCRANDPVCDGWLPTVLGEHRRYAEAGQQVDEAVARVRYRLDAHGHELRWFLLRVRDIPPQGQVVVRPSQRRPPSVRVAPTRPVRLRIVPDG